MRRSVAAFPLALLSILVFTHGSAARGATPRLVRDIRLGGDVASSNPGFMFSLGSRAIVRTGRGDLWGTNGTAPGTVFLAPNVPTVRFAIEAGGSAFLYTEHGMVWATDGTPGGTVFLRSFFGEGFFFFAVPGQRRIFLSANDGDHGQEVWTSDGTVAGTRLVADLAPGSGSSFPSSLAWWNGRLYFAADDGQVGASLWSTDGTAAGTKRIKDFIPGVRQTLGPFGIQALAGRLVFFAFDTHGIGVWTSDGTPQGTVRAKSAAGLNDGLRFVDTTVVGNRYYALFGTDRTPISLWTSDGRGAGTGVLKAFRLPFGEDRLSFNFSKFQLGSRVVFHADDGHIGSELWSSDGTVAGTRPIADFCPGPCGSGIEPKGLAGNRLIAIGYTEALGVELWVAGTSGVGLSLLKDICPGPCSSRLYAYAQLGSKLSFIADDGTHGQEIWTTTGTLAGTVQVTDFADPDPFQSFVPRAAIGSGLVVFTAFDPQHGKELWRTNGRRAGTRFLVDLLPGQTPFSGSAPSRFTAAGSRAVFFANDGEHGFELWSSDASAGGTNLLAELVPGPEPLFSPTFFDAHDADGGLAAYRVPDQAGSRILVTDGTPGGTRTVTAPLAAPLYGELAFLSGALYFVADDHSPAATLWKSEGSGGPPTVVAEVDGVRWLHRFAGRLVFSGSVGGSGASLWSTDGTPGDLRPLAPIVPFIEPAIFSGRFYAFAADADGGVGLWSTDGTEGGDRLVADITPATSQGFGPSPIAGSDRLFVFGTRADQTGLWSIAGNPEQATFVAALRITVSAFGEADPVFALGKLFFAADDPDSSGMSVLWSSDGTGAGTAPVRDASGAKISSPTYLRTFGGHITFVASSRLWWSDGTPAGTEKFEIPTPTFGVPPVVLGNRLVFSAFSTSTGTELWTLEP